MFFDYLMNGLGLGAIFAFIALGYTMVYGIIKLINFAHGEFFMVGAYVGYFCLRDLDIERVGLPQPLPILLDFFVALWAASLVAGLLAVLTERVAYRPVRKAGRIAALLTAVGVSLLLQNIAVQVWGANPRSFPDPRVFHALDDLEGEAQANYYADREFTTTQGETVTEAVLLISQGDVLDATKRASIEDQGFDEVYERVTLSPKSVQYFVILALIGWTPILWFLVKRTRMGKAMRAASEDADAARLMGININLVVALTFFVGAFVAGVGGVAYIATYGKVEPMLGFLPGLKAFVAAVIGGIGSIPGAIIGGLILGVAEAIIPFVLQEVFGWEEAFAWKDAIAFAFLIVVLVVKPTGLLGKPMREKV
ncbi:MAG: branched-chain amino acid ABC transporter permease [Planctomycetota bacterium]|nr:branched-chain amino acid ABC transporter permease [Planctomycetota bacterium]